MAVFRIEKTRDYTVMSNYHLRDRSLSLKAKGLLSLMLSLPEDWDYTMKGLARICKDGIDSIRAGRIPPITATALAFPRCRSFCGNGSRSLPRDDLETGECIRMPRGSFYVTAMSREQMEADGYGFHHASEMENISLWHAGLCRGGGAAGKGQSPPYR